MIFNPGLAVRRSQTKISKRIVELLGMVSRL